MIAPAMFKGYCNSDVFEEYIKEVLVKHLKKGQTAVMDNVSFHKTEAIA